MGKKSRRHYHKKNKKDFVEPHLEEKESALLQEEESRRCPHLGKAVKLGVLQNQVPHIKVGQCSHCKSSNSEESGVCICLRCAKQGCDRYSQEQHALCHHNECPSHNITLHLQSMIAWCYGCDMEVPVVADSDLHECVKLLIKALKLDPTDDHKLAISKMRASTNSEVQQVNNYIISPSNKLSKKIKGLVNLGNTCFFNAVMQNLNQTELLHLGISFVNQSEYSQRIVGPNKTFNVHVTNPAGSLLVSLNKLLVDFRSSSPGPLNPKFLFSEICKKAPRFKGFQQQDSQELLRYLLDSIKTDQLKRIKLGVLKEFEVSEGVDITRFPADKKEKIKEYVHLVTAPCIDSVFSGELDSIVVCHQCHKESRVTESFLDLSLSLIKQQEQTEKSSSGKSSKKNLTPSLEKKNIADESKEVKQTPLSKHQQKVAREAKRKKGRKKGKQITNSRSSEDGFNEVAVKHLYVDDNAIDVSSEHERQEGDINDCRSEDSDEYTQSDKDDNPDLASKFDEKREFPSPKDQETTPNLQGNRQKEDKTHSEPSLELINSVDSHFEMERDGVFTSQGLDSNKTKDFVSKLKNCQSCSERSIEPLDGRLIENDSELEKEPCETLRLTNVNQSSITDVIGRVIENELTQVAENCYKHDDIHNQIGTGSSGSEEHPSKEDSYTSKSVDGVLTTCLEKKTATSKSIVIETTAERKPFFKNMAQVAVECEKGCSIETENKNDAQSHGCVEKVNNAILNMPNDSRAECAVASSEGTKHTLNFICDKEGTKHLNEHASDLSGNLQNELSVREEMKTVTSELNDIKLLNSWDRTVITEPKNHCCSTDSKEEDVECIQTASEAVTHSNILHKKSIKSEITFGNKSSTDVSGLSRNMDKPNLENEPPLDIASYNDEIIHFRKNKFGKKIGGPMEFVPESLDETNHMNNIQRDGFDANINNNESNICEKSTIFPTDFTKTQSIPRNNDVPLQNVSNIDINGHITTSTRVFTVGTPYNPSPGECSVQSCLAQFCSPEILQGNNMFLCEFCSKTRDFQDDDLSSDESAKGAKAPKKVYTEATKQLLISSPPPVLTLHLKRFQQVGHGLKKVLKHVEFPLVLDLAPFCCRGSKTAADSSDAVLYSLTGLVEHSGGLNSGHYTACIKLKHTPTYNAEIENIRDLSSFIQELWAKDEGTGYTHERPGEGQWYYVSDSRIAMVNEEKVERSQAYMLFYERLPLKRTSQ